MPNRRRAKRVLGEQQAEYKWVDIEQDPEAVSYVERVNVGKHIIPTIVFRGRLPIGIRSSAARSARHRFVFVAVQPSDISTRILVFAFWVIHPHGGATRRLRTQ